MDENGIGRILVDSAVALHRELGPGLLESVYEAVLAYDPGVRGLQVDRQVRVPFVFRGIEFDEGFRMDICVESRVIVEIKCVEELHRAHKKQLLTYLRLSNHRLGFLLNFGSSMMKDGIIRTVNGL